MNGWIEFLLGIMFLLGTSCLVWFGLIPIMAKANFIFTDEDTGFIKAIMRGGNVIRFIGKIPDDGKFLDEQSGKIHSGPPPLKTSWLSKYRGVRFIGIPPASHIYSYTFSWVKWALKEGTSEYGLIPKKEELDRIKYRSTYAGKFTSSDTRDGLQVSVTMQFSVVLMNVRLALFNTNNWLAEVNGAIGAALRDFTSGLGYDQLLKMKNEVGQTGQTPGKSRILSGFVETILKINEIGFGNIPLVELAGVKVDRVSFISMEVEEPRGEIAKSTMAGYTAAKEAKVIRAKGTATADAKLAQMTAEADGLKKQLAAAGGEPKTLALLKLAEAIEKHQGTLALGGNISTMIGDKPSGG